MNRISFLTRGYAFKGLLAVHFLQDFHFKLHFKSFPHSNALATYVDLVVK